jgi:hypothetical protein
MYGSIEEWFGDYPKEATNQINGELGVRVFDRYGF